MSKNSAKNKRIAKNTLLLYVRSLFIMLISLYTSRVVLQSLGVQDYGIYNVVGGMVAMFTMLSHTMASASQRFITYTLGENDFDKLKKVFTTSITLHVCLGGIVVLLIEIFGVWFLYNGLNIPTERLNVALWVLQLSIATLFVNIISVPFNAVIIAHEQMSAFAYIGILECLLKLGVALSLSIAPVNRLVLYAVLMFAVSVLLRMIYSIYSHRSFSETRNVHLHIEPGLFKEMFSFAGWNLFGNGSLVFRNQGIDILLNIFFGVTVNAAKGICNQVQHAVHQLIGNFQTAVNPQLTMSVAQKDYTRTHTLIFQGGRFSFYLMTLFAVPLIVATPQILSLWLVTVPLYTVEFVRWTLVYMLWDVLSRFLINAVLAYGKIKQYEIVIGGTKLLALPLAYVWLLIAANPLVGVWINILLEMVCLSLRLGFTSRFVNLDWMRFIKKVVIRCWLVFGIALLVPYYFEKVFTCNILIIVFVAMAWTVLCVGFVGMTTNERNFVLNKLQSSLINRI